MSDIIDRIAFGRGAYIVFVTGVVVALAFADLPVPIFLAFSATVIGIGILAEAASRLASKKLIEMSAPAASMTTQPASVTTAAPVAVLHFKFAQVQAEPEFAQIQDWFTNTAIGSFA